MCYTLIIFIQFITLFFSSFLVFTFFFYFLPFPLLISCFCLSSCLSQERKHGSLHLTWWSSAPCFDLLFLLTSSAPFNWIMCDIHALWTCLKFVSPEFWWFLNLQTISNHFSSSSDIHLLRIIFSMLLEILLTLSTHVLTSRPICIKKNKTTNQAYLNLQCFA